MVKPRKPHRALLALKVTKSNMRTKEGVRDSAGDAGEGERTTTLELQEAKPKIPDSHQTMIKKVIPIKQKPCSHLLWLFLQGAGGRIVTKFSAENFSRKFCKIQLKSMLHFHVWKF